jgi:repressor LexA
MTERQKQLLDFITARIAETDGIAPSFDEMREHLGLKSKSGIHKMVTALCERGYLVRLKHRARAIHIPDKVTRNGTESEAVMQIDGVLRDFDNHTISPLDAVNRIKAIRTFHMGGV